MSIAFSRDESSLFANISAAAKSLGQDAYVIGGFVRDKILKRPSTDIDVVTTGDGIALAHAVARDMRPKPKVAFFKNFGTAQIRAGSYEVEFVGARKESYRGESRKPDVAPGTLEDDQNRRDFTINALAVSLNEKDYGQLSDPFGGLQDLQDRIMRTPLDPDITFSDDPLRMMRCVRFAAQLNFQIHPDTWEALHRNKSRLSIISQERITEEVAKIIRSPRPSTGFDLLFRSGLLQEFFPQMADLAGVEIVEGKGHKDNFYHTLQVLDNVALRTDNYWLRWAAILHDIAKPPTKRYEPGHGWTFHGHDALGAKMAGQIFRKLKLPTGEELRYVQKLVALHLRPISLSKEDITDSAMRRLLFEAGEDLEDLMILCESDITSKNQKKVARYLQNFALVKERLQEVEDKDQMRAWQPPVNGDDILRIFGLEANRDNGVNIVGPLKTAIREAILDGDIENTREAALELLFEKASVLGLKAVAK